MFTGVGKSADELARAIALGLKTINVESPGELDRLDRLAEQQRVIARVALRVNPDIDARVTRISHRTENQQVWCPD